VDVKLDVLSQAQQTTGREEIDELLADALKDNKTPRYKAERSRAKHRDAVNVRCLRCCSEADEHVEARRLRENARLLLKADKWMGNYVCCRIGARISEALLWAKLTNKSERGGGLGGGNGT
jgi:hypothetical protein